MKNNPQFLTSKLLVDAGVSHGWFMRYGGVSKGSFESLNGKKGSGDSNENVEENRRRALVALDAMKAKNKTQRLAHIIHEFGTNILVANGPGEFKGFDASITTNEELMLSQTTADCGTVIIADTKRSIVGLVHGSWHTLRGRIICDVIAKMKEHTKNELVAGLGPMICKDCYEFGPEAADLFDIKYLTPVSVIPAKAGIQQKKAYLIDLKQMIVDQLHESDITQIDDVEVCTLEDERFFSHRRGGARSGRFLTLASIKC